MKLTELDIPGVFLIVPDVFEDKRGFFYESYNKEVFARHGIHTKFVQDNVSGSAKGTLRGLHYQIAPRAQAKLVRVVKGEAFDVSVDIREGSKTFGRSISVYLSEENGKMLYVPPGFAHGFCALRDRTEFLYKVSEFYSPEHERGIKWNDPALKIEWPKLDVEFIVSDRDQKFPFFKSLF
ncbi:MAG: dTDP-4-dehydrorhamnose 3,5-epimerase [Omnitrophica bacterium RIFCSPLOWO2_12_FULL_50_11]|nr:MAG: dTDP-4-dehydrorhamnose 3,5-epimerase [Omnitrophica bacterium RIFCSPLOWO2_12_FULL_50_11]